ncbi:MULTISPECIES: TadE/TadG family type IV pilus assembly protein [Halocynthiibacter]|uniref:Pilus assembly protein n=1 Tax=Halocynthiibacter halioticoli TaxID=2986804 RepID=A0AAE3J0T9_9RHOB|nr:MULTISPECIES: TadE/TadG family type IV pilus assembly protein [Halocynthiibacter]MCV6824438.1 pilus assembly protein [Halocynthiibacter halioticoli]MCW4057439.1 pilus assembly protein [Halocynthiibacter sp. SDUM655004]
MKRLGQHKPTDWFAIWRDDRGVTMVELAIVIPLFLLLFFGMIDFGRMAFHYVTAEKAMHVAARVATVRPAACPSVPQVNARGPLQQNQVPPQFGTNCSAGANTCANPGVIACAGSAGNATANEIWGLLQGALPNDATISNLRFVYSYDENLGFLGGPYVPVVTVELQNLNFQFVSPLGALVGLTGATAPAGLGATVSFPTMSVSMPAEDLSHGNTG